jgi:chromate transport protein ChrA
VGVVVGKIIAGLPSLFWGLHWLWKRYQARTDFISSIKIFTASIIAAMITHLSLNFLNTSDWIRLAFGGIIFLMVYIFAAPILGAITQKDIINLRTMFSGLGFISKLMDLPLFVAERTAKINFIKKD